LKKSGDEYKNRYNKKGCENLYVKYTTNEKGEGKINEDAYTKFYKLAEDENTFIRKTLEDPHGVRSFPNKLHCFCTFDKKNNPKGYKDEEKKL